MINLKLRVINLIAIALLSLSAIALIPTPTIAATVKSEPADTAREASEAVVKETGAKEQFGKTPSGDRLIDQAKNKANKKLKDLAEQADSGEDLPSSQENFLNNLQEES